MEFLAHRGAWSNRVDQNSFSALCDALDKGFGLETDIRDLNGQLVISHDLPIARLSMPLEQLLAYYKRGSFASSLALNIKADGLQAALSRMLEKFNIKNYFVFDMSIPDTLYYLKFDMCTFIRCSELEKYPKLELLTHGVWLDELTRSWINKSVIIEKAQKAKKVCIVSGELHGREYISQWGHIRDALSMGGLSEKLLLCTDYPEEAERFFNECN